MAQDVSLWPKISPYGQRSFLMAPDLSLWPKTSPYGPRRLLMAQDVSLWPPTSLYGPRRLLMLLMFHFSKQCRNPVITTPQASLGRNNAGIQLLRHLKPVYVPFGRNNAGIQSLRHFRPVDAPRFSRNHAGI